MDYSLKVAMEKVFNLTNKDKCKVLWHNINKLMALILLIIKMLEAV
jgi:hypothetical protein